jgi:hypothetical protein
MKSGGGPFKESQHSEVDPFIPHVIWMDGSCDFCYYFLLLTYLRGSVEDIWVQGMPCFALAVRDLTQACGFISYFACSGKWHHNKNVSISSGISPPDSDFIEWLHLHNIWNCEQLVKYNWNLITQVVMLSSNWKIKSIPDRCNCIIIQLDGSLRSILSCILWIKNKSVSFLRSDICYC